MDWGLARRQLNDALRRMAEEAHGRPAVEKFVHERLEESLSGWLEQWLGGKPGRGKRTSALTVAEQVARLLKPRVQEPSLLIGAGTGAMAAALGVGGAIESEAWRLQVARAAFPGLAIAPGDFFQAEGRWRTIVAVDYLRSLARSDGYGQLRDFFPAVSARLTDDGRLLLSDLQAYQDDCVAQLAALEFEIEEIVAVPASDRMVLIAQK